jgi:hypothetical protein
MFGADPDRGMLAFAVAALAVWMAVSAIRPMVDFQVDERGVTVHLRLCSQDKEARFPARFEAAWQRLWSRP